MSSGQEVRSTPWTWCVQRTPPCTRIPGLIVSTRECPNFGDAWLTEMARWSCECQISLPYLLWKYGLWPAPCRSPETTSLFARTPNDKPVVSFDAGPPTQSGLARLRRLFKSGLIAMPVIRSVGAQPSTRRGRALTLASQSCSWANSAQSCTESTPSTPGSAGARVIEQGIKNQTPRRGQYSPAARLGLGDAAEADFEADDAEPSWA